MMMFFIIFVVYLSQTVKYLATCDYSPGYHFTLLDILNFVLHKNSSSEPGEISRTQALGEMSCHVTRDIDNHASKDKPSL